MIGQLTGTVALIGIDEAILNVGGVGYLLKCGQRTLSSLQVGEVSTLQVETHVRENAIVLFGFADENERAWFVRLQSVQKVGPKAALAILDVLSPAEILSAAALEDKTAFARANGVGPSLAGRIVLDLAGKPAPMGRGFSQDISPPPAVSDNVVSGTAQKDSVSALVNLGISQSDALRAVASAGKIVGEDDVNELVKAALKELGK